MASEPRGQGLLAPSARSGACSYQASGGGTVTTRVGYFLAALLA